MVASWALRHRRREEVHGLGWIGFGFIAGDELVGVGFWKWWPWRGKGLGDEVDASNLVGFGLHGVAEDRIGLKGCRGSSCGFGCFCVWVFAGLEVKG